MSECVCTLGAAKPCRPLPSFLPSGANRLPLHFNHTHTHTLTHTPESTPHLSLHPPSSTRVTSTPPPPRSCCRIPRSQMTCPPYSDTLCLSFSLSYSFQNIFLFLQARQLSESSEGESQFQTELFTCKKKRSLPSFLREP